MAPKIATCSFCGTRAALVLAGETRHELACSACGAPLHDLRALPQEPRKAGAWEAPKPKKKKKYKSAKKPPHQMVLPDLDRALKRSKRRLKKRMLFKAFKAVEDIFD